MRFFVINVLKLMTVPIIFLGFTVTEVKIKDEDLLVTCPKGDFVFYRCRIKEFKNGIDFYQYSHHCHPAEGVERIPLKSWLLICPLDGTLETRRNYSYRGRKYGQVHTNKGWMPK